MTSPRLWLFSLSCFVMLSSVGCASTPQPERGSAACDGKCDDTSGSCRESCGGQSESGTCWCDDKCAAFRDCCTDMRAVCEIADYVRIEPGVFMMGTPVGEPGRFDDEPPPHRVTI